MQRLQAFVLVVAATVHTAGLVRAQSLTHTDLILGQPAALQVSGAIPGADVAFLLSLTGIGSGTCFPPTTLCLDVLEPVTILSVTPADAGGGATFATVVPPAIPLLTVFAQAVVVSSGAGGVTLAKTTPFQTSVQTLSALSDTFTGSTLSSSWSVWNPGLVQITVTGGSLRLQPLATGNAATWFADGEGPMVYKSVTGDFTVTATIHARNPLAPTQPPPFPYRLGGLIVRDPNSVPGNRNSAHVALGAGTAAVPVAAEDKTTVASSSDFILYPISTPDGELRITRQGALIALYFRAVGATSWTLLRSHLHPEFAATVQVGAMVYSNSAPASIVAIFDDVTFSP